MNEMDDTGEGSGYPARRLAEMLIQYESSRRAVFGYLHASWLDTLPAASRWLITLEAARLPDCAEALLELLGLGAPPLEVFHGPAANLVALPVDAALHALRFRALWACRGELRHWIDRSRRTLLDDWIGPRAAAILRAEHAQPLGHASWLNEVPALDTMSAQELAWSGYCLFDQDGILPTGGPAALVRLALPRDALAPQWIAARGSAAGCNESLEVMAQLPQLLAEHSW